MYCCSVREKSTTLLVIGRQLKPFVLEGETNSQVFVVLVEQIDGVTVAGT